jgi:hypothetical protein
MVVRASAIGGCMWELVAHAQQKDAQPYPQFLLNAFARGTELEPIVLGRLEKLGWTFDGDFTQTEGQLGVGPNRVVRFHPDSVGSSPNFHHRRLVEVKSAAHSQFRKAQLHGVESLFPEYAWQLSVMMHGLRLPAVWVVVDKDNDELHFQYVDKPLIPLGEIVKRVKEVYDGAVGEDIVLAEKPCEQPDQFPCRFIHLRPETEREERAAVAVDPADLEAFEQAAWEYDDARAQEAHLKKVKEECRNRLIALAEACAVGLQGANEKPALPTLATTSWRVAWTTSTRTSVDHAGMRKDGIDVDSYTSKKETVSIQVVKADA